MPEKKTVQRARAGKRAGKAPATQAGAFVREEIHHVREGKHGARSTKQAIAIGLAKARRASVKLPAPPRSASATTKQRAAAANRAGRHHKRKVSPRRARAALEALEDESRRTASRQALSRHAKAAAHRRPAAARRASARQAARTRARRRA